MVNLPLSALGASAIQNVPQWVMESVATSPYATSVFGSGGGGYQPMQSTYGWEHDLLADYLLNSQTNRMATAAGYTGMWGGNPTLERLALQQQGAIAQAQLAAQTQGQQAQLAMAQMQYAAQQAQAQRQYALDLQYFGLAEAQFRFQQRIQGAQQRLNELSLLATQRGPQNAIAYNYLLGNIDAPEGESRGRSGGGGGGWGGGGMMGSPMMGGYGGGGGGGRATYTPPLSADPETLYSQVMDQALAYVSQHGVPQPLAISMPNDPRGRLDAAQRSVALNDPAQALIDGFIAEHGVPIPRDPQTLQSMLNNPAALEHQLQDMMGNLYSLANRWGAMSLTPERYMATGISNINPSPGLVDDFRKYLVDSGFAEGYTNTNQVTGGRYGVKNPGDILMLRVAGPGTRSAEQYLAGLQSGPWEQFGFEPIPPGFADNRGAVVANTALANLISSQAGASDPALLAALSNPLLMNNPQIMADVLGGMVPAPSVAGTPQRSALPSWIDQAPAFVQQDYAAASSPAPQPQPSLSQSQQAQVDSFLSSAHPEAATALRLMGFNEGGDTDSPILLVGEGPGAKPAKDAEMIINWTGAPITVIPPRQTREVLEGEYIAPPRANTGGNFGRWAAMGMGPWGQGGGGQGAGGQGGGFGGALFNPQTEPDFFGQYGGVKFSPEEIVGMPAIQQVTGGMDAPWFGENLLNMQFPDTDVSLPMGHQANVRTLSRMMPSSLATLQSGVETPRDMGGLGLDWGDWVEAALRGAPIGMSRGVAGYGV